MELFFKVLAAPLLLSAAYFFWQENKEASFVSFVFAACSYLLSVRFQIKKRILAREEAGRNENNVDL